PSAASRARATVAGSEYSRRSLTATCFHSLGAAGSGQPIAPGAMKGRGGRMSHRTHPLLCRQLPVVIAPRLLLAALALIGSPVTAQEDVTAVITRAAERMAKVQSFHFTVTTPRGKTQITEQIELAGVEGDIQRPDRFRASFTAKAAVVTLTVKVVGIGN